MSDDLLALTSLDGRYSEITAALREHHSEFAFIRDRLRIEIAYLIALASQARLIRPFTASELDSLKTLQASFSLEDAQQVKHLERLTRHDVKAIENFLRGRLAEASLADCIEWLHFGLTSEDVNNIAGALALRGSRDQVLLPALDTIIESLIEMVRAHAAAPMLARTHGQPAVPTTFGKEMAVFLTRLQKRRSAIASHRFEAKLNGAVGDFNAVTSAASQVDWLEFSRNFIQGLGLEPNSVTTQILPYDNWVEYFNHLHLTNSILLDLAQDIWHYISDGYLKLRLVLAEVGSSTMPHKVNPIDFENAEGNLGLANALFEEYARKLPVSRLQRDLSDSTIRRTFGTALGHTLVAYVSLARGLERLEADEAVMKSELEKHWEVIAEGAQTILRAAGIADAYEQLKSLTRGRELTEEGYRQWVDAIQVEQSVKEKLRALSPLTYLGLAEQIARQTLEEK